MQSHTVEDNESDELQVYDWLNDKLESDKLETGTSTELVCVTVRLVGL